MRILLIGATGTIGNAVGRRLGSGHEIIAVTRHSSPHAVDIAQPDSLRALFRAVGQVDAIVSAAGAARFAPCEKLSDADFEFSLANKLMGQVNVIRYGLPSVCGGGSITVTSGILAFRPMHGSAAISLVNAGLEGFVAGAALESARGIRINVVSPPWVTETLQAMNRELAGDKSAAAVAELYATSVEGVASGHLIRFGESGAVESVPLTER